MTQDLTEISKRLDEAWTAPFNSPKESLAMLQTLRAILRYLEQQPATAQMTVTQEPELTDAPPPCEHEDKVPSGAEWFWCNECGAFWSAAGWRLPRRWVPVKGA